MNLGGEVRDLPDRVKAFPKNLDLELFDKEKFEN